MLDDELNIILLYNRGRLQLSIYKNTPSMRFQPAPKDAFINVLKATLYSIITALFKFLTNWERNTEGKYVSYTVSFFCKRNLNGKKVP